MTDWTPSHGRPRLPVVRAQSGPPTDGSPTVGPPTGGSAPPAPPPPPPNAAPPQNPPPTTSSSPPAGSGPAPWWRLLLILAPIAGLLLLVAVFVFTLSGRSGPVDLSADLAPGTSLNVRIPSAEVTLEASDDGQVHVRMTGSYFGTEPTLTARTTHGVTEVRGGCRSRLFSRCSVSVTVQLPSTLPTTVEGENGRITASALTGRLDLQTTNGTIETTGTLGRVDLRTTNGDIRVADAASASVARSEERRVGKECPV